jgi:hypothetical protein
MNTIKAKCEICGEVDIDIVSTEDGFIIPVKLCPTLEDIDKIMIEQFGETYKEQTGVEIEKTFSKRICNILHESPDDLGDEAYKHKLEPLECWVDF